MPTRFHFLCRSCREYSTFVRYDAALTCGSVKAGAYVEVDGEKVSEQLFLADDLTISR